MKNANIVKQNQDIMNVFIATGFILMIPVIGMQVSSEWDWKLFDFIIIGSLLVTAGLSYIFAARKMKNHRFILGFVIALAVLLIWTELAVGIFGTPFAGS